MLTEMRTYLPGQVRVETEEVVEVIDQEWSEPIHRLAFERTGLRLTDVFDEQGRRCCPTDAQQQLFVEARRL